jgi:hypothetical protein
LTPVAGRFHHAGMADPALDSEVSAYLASPVGGDRLPATWKLSPVLLDLIRRLAADQGAAPDAWAEYALFKAVRAAQARRMVGEPPDFVPASFQNDLVAQAKRELEKDRTALAAREGRGDKADRVAGAMEDLLNRAQAPDEHLEAVQRKAALSDATLDIALAAEAAKKGG